MKKPDLNTGGRTVSFSIDIFIGENKTPAGVCKEICV